MQALLQPTTLLADGQQARNPPPRQPHTGKALMQVPGLRT